MVNAGEVRIPSGATWAGVTIGVTTLGCAVFGVGYGEVARALGLAWGYWLLGDWYSVFLLGVVGATAGFLAALVTVAVGPLLVRTRYGLVAFVLTHLPAFVVFLLLLWVSSTGHDLLETAPLALLLSLVVVVASAGFGGWGRWRSFVVGVRSAGAATETMRPEG